MRALLLIAALIQAPATPPAQPAAPPPGTDIYLVPFSGTFGSWKFSKPTPVSIAPGYDNQPMFSPNGSRILFAANHDGKQTDIYAFDRPTGRVSQLTRTPENENSPTFLPVGIGPVGGFSVVRTELDRTQRLWWFDASGRNPQLILPDVKPVGYHAWIDSDRLALFVLGQPNSLQVASVKTGKSEVVANGIGRSLHKIPGTRMISVVHRDPSGDYLIKQVHVESKHMTPLGKVIEGSTERDMAWMPDGQTILMSAGTKIYSYASMNREAGWTEVFDAAAHGLGAVTRLAVSGKVLAIVVSEPKR